MPRYIQYSGTIVERKEAKQSSHYRFIISYWSWLVCSPREICSMILRIMVFDVIGAFGSLSTSVFLFIAVQFLQMILIGNFPKKTYPSKSIAKKPPPKTKSNTCNCNKTKSFETKNYIKYLYTQKCVSLFLHPFRRESKPFTLYVTKFFLQFN